MNWRRFNLISVAVFGLVVIGGVWFARQASGQAQPAANAAAVAPGDIELGKPVKYPQVFTPMIEEGMLKDGHHGEQLTPQAFVIDQATHEISIPKPPPRQRSYNDCKIDSVNYASDLDLFNLVTPDKAPIGKIVVTSAKKKVTISPNYVISPTVDKPAPIDPVTYCANVTFAKGDESNKPGTTVTVKRNQDAPTPAEDVLVSRISRKNDVMTWTVERGGAVVKSGAFGFPVVATAPDVVKYVIQLP